MPTVDSRNGDYIAFASNGQEYAMSVNFDAKTVSLNGPGVAASSTLSAVDSSNKNFSIPATSTLLAGNADGITSLTDGIVGSIKMTTATGPVTFIAARNFVTTLADAAGQYTLLGRTRQVGVNTSVFEGTITPSGSLTTCDSTTDTCASPKTYALTTSGGTFTAVGTDTFTFRIARMGAERIFLRADTEPGNSTFTVGLPPSEFGASDFDGRDNAANRVSYSWNGMSPATMVITPSTGRASTITMGVVASGPGPTGLRLNTTTSDGAFFSMRNSALGVIVGAPRGAAHQGFVFIGTAR